MTDREEIRMTVTPFKRTRRPGEFRARCNQPETWEPAPAELVEEWRAHLAVPIPYGDPQAVAAHKLERQQLESSLSEWPAAENNEWGRWAPCGFDTEDRDEFELHMREVHSLKPGQIRGHDGRIGPLQQPALVGRGFRLQPPTTHEKTLLGHRVTILLNTKQAVTAQVWSQVDGWLIRERLCSTFLALDDAGNGYVFAWRPKTVHTEAFALTEDGVEYLAGKVGWMVGLVDEHTAVAS